MNVRMDVDAPDSGVLPMVQCSFSVPRSQYPGAEYFRLEAEMSFCKNSLRCDGALGRFALATAEVFLIPDRSSPANPLPEMAAAMAHAESPARSSTFDPRTLFAGYDDYFVAGDLRAVSATRLNSAAA